MNSLFLFGLGSVVMIVVAAFDVKNQTYNTLTIGLPLFLAGFIMTFIA